jgi:lipopolysaccharide transport protein LptA
MALAAVAGGIAAGRPAQAALADDGRSLEASPDATVVTADKLTFDYIKKFALFEGRVQVNDPRLQLSSDRLTIVFTEDGGAQTIKAEGKVLLTQGDKKARSEVAVYDVPTGKIVLSGGPPQVMQGRNILEGESSRSGATSRSWSACRGPGSWCIRKISATRIRSSSRGRNRLAAARKRG